MTALAHEGWVPTSLGSASRRGVVSPRPWPTGRGYTLAAVRLPRSKDELAMTLHAVASVLAPGGHLLLYGANDEGIKSIVRRLEPVFVRCTDDGDRGALPCALGYSRARRGTPEFVGGVGYGVQPTDRRAPRRVVDLPRCVLTRISRSRQQAPAGNAPPPDGGEDGARLRRRDRIHRRSLQCPGCPGRVDRRGYGGARGGTGERPRRARHGGVRFGGDRWSDVRPHCVQSANSPREG